MNTSKSNKITYFIICVIITTLLNLHLTNFIINNIKSSHSIIVPNVFELTYYENTGAAFSIFQNNILFLVIIAILAVVILSTLLIKHVEKSSMLTCFFFATLTSGIICNTYERLSLGFVRDFFNLKFINFPIFNISDVLINVSVLAIMIIVLKYNKKKD